MSAAEDSIVEVGTGLNSGQEHQEEHAPGYELRKALGVLLNLVKEGRVIWSQVEQELNPTLPSKTTNYFIARFLRSAQEFFRHRNHEDDMPNLDKGFATYAKYTAAAYVSTFNPLNFFGTTIGFMITDKRARITNNPAVHTVSFVMTMIFLPFSLITLGLAWSLDHLPQCINNVAIMLVLQIIYMSVMWGLLGYYLVPNSSIGLAVGIAVSVGGVLILVPAVIFRRPNLCELFPQKQMQTEEEEQQQQQHGVQLLKEVAAAAAQQQQPQP